MTIKTRRFALHYAEMIGAMFLGMHILGLPLALALSPFGVELHGDELPTLRLAAMAVTMTAPMVAWMRFRGHAWAACTDMTAAMAIPTLGVLALLWAGLVEDIGTLLLLEHLVMLPSMFVAMLLRHDEYTCSPHRRGSGLRGPARLLPVRVRE